MICYFSLAISFCHKFPVILRLEKSQTAYLLATNKSQGDEVVVIT